MAIDWKAIKQQRQQEALSAPKQNDINHRYVMAQRSKALPVQNPAVADPRQIAINKLLTIRSGAQRRDRDTSAYDIAILRLQGRNDEADQLVTSREQAAKYNAARYDSTENLQKTIDKSLDLDNVQDVVRGLGYGPDTGEAARWFVKYRSGAIWHDEENEKKYQTLLNTIEQNRTTAEKVKSLDNAKKIAVTGLDGKSYNYQDLIATRVAENQIADIGLSQEDAGKALAELNKGNYNAVESQAVSGDLLKSAGWDASGDTVNYAKAYSNDRDKAAVFSPVVFDAAGNVQRVLTPAEMEQYAQKVLAGGDDELNLCVSEVYEGMYAPSLAKENANRVRRLSERYYNNTDLTGLANDAIQGDVRYLGTEEERQAVESAQKQLGEYGVNYDEYSAYQNRLRTQEKNQRIAQEYAEWSTETSQKASLATFGNILLSPAKALEYVGNVFGNMIDNAKAGDNLLSSYRLPDTYDDLATNLINGSTEAITEGIRDGIRGDGNSPWLNALGDLAAQTYGGITSTIQSALTVLAAKAVLPPGIFESVGLAVIGTEAANDTYHEVIENGGTISQATVYSAIAGFNEILTEKISLDRLLSIEGKTGVKALLKEMLLQGFVEGSEEVASEFLDEMADRIVNMDKSSYERTVRKYMEEGLSEEAAKKQADADFLTQVAWSFYGGFIGGGIGGVGKASLSAVQKGYSTAKESALSSIYTRQNTSKIAESGSAASVMEEAQKIIDQGGNTKALKKAVEKVESLSPEDKGYDKAVSKVYTEISKYQLSEYKESGTSARSEVVRKKVNDLAPTGFSEEQISTMASIVDKTLTSDNVINDLTKAEKAVYNQSETRAVIDQAVRELRSEEGQRSIKDQATRNYQNRYDKMEETAVKAGVVKPQTAYNDTFSVTDTGENLVDNKPVEVQKFTGISSDDMTVQLDDGTEIKASDISWGDSNLPAVFGSVLRLQKLYGVPFTAEFVNTVYQAYQLEKSKSKSFRGDVFSWGIEKAFDDGYIGKRYTGDLLSPEVANLVTEAARKVREANAEKADHKIEKAEKQGKKKGSVTVEGNIATKKDGSVDKSKLNPKQKVGVEIIEKLADKLGINFRLFRSEFVNGKWVSNYAEKGKSSPNGFYKDGVIYVDINAGNNGEGLILFTVSHELVHYIRDGSKRSFNRLADFLVQNYSTQGMTIQDYIEIERRNGKLSRDEAYEEAVARLCENFLADVHLSEKAEQLYRTNRSLCEKIVDFLKDIAQKIKEAFAGVKPQSELGRIGAEIAQKHNEVLDLFIEGIHNASENLAYAENTIGEGVRFETRETEDGHKYVSIPIADIVGEGITDTDNIGKKARIYLTNRFRGVILPVGKTKSAYVNKGTISEITNPAKYLEDEVYRGKMLAVTELDNLLRSSTYMSWNYDDGRHPGTLRWLKYKTYFLFTDTSGNNQVYSGIISIRRIARGDVLHDITQLKNITNDNIGSSIIKHAAESASDVSSNIILDTEGKIKREFADTNTKFSIREEEPPKNTIIGYKVFRVKDGKLYPPMVANPGGAETPVGVWLNADVGERAPDSKTGRAQVKGKGGMSLSFRPGWHLGDMPRASQFDRMNPETGVKDMFPADFVWAECDCAADVDYQDEAMSYGYTDKGKFRHAYAGLPRVPENGYYKYRTNPRPDTVPWIITGAIKVNRILSDAEVAEILEKNGINPPQRQGGNKTLAEMGLNNDHIRYDSRDADYLSAVESGDMQTAQRMVDEAAKAAGFTIRAYHGTSRADRVGYVFLPERATSGPMAFFSSDKGVAEGYSKTKRDTSVSYDPDYDMYETQFRIKTKYKDMPLYKAWGYLPFSARNRITKLAGQLRENWDGDNELILDPDTNEANGGFQFQLKRCGGNTIRALIDQWLNSGNLFNEERKFIDVLTMTGVIDEFKKIGMDSFYYKDPDARYEKVYDTYLALDNPFDTSAVDEKFISSLIEWYENSDTDYERESADSDLWDKNSIDAYDFADRLKDDLENNTTHAWTSIPDSVTDYLKSLGYDSIIDKGGKYSGIDHEVYIPFSSYQIKSADAVTYDDAGKVIPLSQRFFYGEKDIRYDDSRNMDALGDDDLFGAEYDTDEIEDVFARHYLTHSEAIGEVLRNTADIEIAPNTFKNIVGRVLKDNLGSVDAKTKKELAVRIQLELENAKTADPENIVNNVISAVRKIVPDIKVEDERIVNQINSLKDYFSGRYYLTDDQIADLKANDESLGSFRRKMMGKVDVINKDTAKKSITGQVQNASELSLEDIHDFVDAEEIFHINRSQWNEYSYHVPMMLIQAFEDLEAQRNIPLSKMASEEELDNIAVNLAAKITGAAVQEKYNSRKNPYVKNLVDQFEQRKKEAVKKRNDYYNERMKEIRSKRDQKIADMQKKHAEQRQSEHERRTRAEFRERIRKIHKSLRDMAINPKANKYIPKELITPAMDLLNTVNLDSGFQGDRADAFREKLSKMADALRKIALKNEAEAEFDSALATMLDDLNENVGSVPLGRMNLSQLKRVHDVLKALQTNIRNRVMTVGEENARYIGDLAFKWMGEIDEASSKQYDKLMFKYTQKGMSYDEANQKALDKISKKIESPLYSSKTAANVRGFFTKWGYSMLSPERFFNMVSGGAKNNVGSELFRMMDDGQRYMIELETRWRQMFSSLVNDRKNAKTFEEKVDVGLKDENGRTVKISRGMMLSLYMHLLNEDNIRHVMGGGLTVPFVKAYYNGNTDDAWGRYSARVSDSTSQARAIRKEIQGLRDKLNKPDAEYTQAEKNAIWDEINDKEELFNEEVKRGIEEYINPMRTRIEKQLTDYDRAWVKTAQQFFDVESKNELNKVTYQMYGFEKAVVEHYFPIHSDSSFVEHSFEEIKKDLNLENAGFMKNRVMSANPIFLEDIADVINRQISSVSRYCGMVLPMANVKRVLNVKTDKVSVANSLNRFNKKAMQYINNLMTDLVGGRQEKSGILQKARHGLAGSALLMNAKVAIKQAASYPTAAAEIGGMPLVKAFFKGGRNNWMLSRAGKELIYKYSPLLAYRSMGYSTQELGDLNDSKGWIDRVVNHPKMKWACGWIQGMDSATVGRLWYASQYYVDDQFSELKKGSDEYYQKVAEVFNRVIERTQPNYTVMQRPDLLRNPNSALKMFTMFMTQRLQNYNIVYDAAITYNKMKLDKGLNRNGVTQQDVTAARKNLVRAVSSQLFSAFVLTGMTLLADALMHKMNPWRDDDDEITGGSAAKRFILYYLDALIGSVAGGSEVFNAITVMLGDGTWYGLSANGFDSLNDLTSYIIKGVQTKDGAYFTKAAKSLASIAGIPLQNAINIFKAGQLHIEDIVNGKFMSFESGANRTNKQNIHRAWSAFRLGKYNDSKAIITQLKTDADHGKLRSAIRELMRDDYLVARKNKDTKTMASISNFMTASGLYVKPDVTKTVNKWWDDADKDKIGELEENTFWLDALNELIK